MILKRQLYPLLPLKYSGPENQQFLLSEAVQYSKKLVLGYATLRTKNIDTEFDDDNQVLSLN